MIDKEIYRKNFRGGGMDMGAGASGMGSGQAAPGPGDTGGAGGYGGDQRGNIGSSPTSTGGGGDNQFTEFTKDVLNPEIDYVGETIFGPTQKYTGKSSFFGGANPYGYTDQYTSGPNFGDLKPGFGGRFFGGLMSLLTGIPFIGGALGNAYDYGTGIFRNKYYDDMSEYNRLGLYGVDPVLSDNYSDVKISDTSFNQDNNGIQSIMVPPVKPIQVNQTIKFEDMIPRADYIPPYTP